ncbi:hypothetical protein A8B78_04095 [Jannaschia sp. EhC01]|nr:hypothetical protein A8B78_04095 [Jannaschia sp. EhC01]
MQGRRRSGYRAAPFSFVDARRIGADELHVGAGLVSALESSWLNDNRNSGMTRARVEAGILQTIRAAQMTWPPGVVSLDITNTRVKTGDFVASYVDT